MELYDLATESMEHSFNAVLCQNFIPHTSQSSCVYTTHLLHHIRIRMQCDTTTPKLRCLLIDQIRPKMNQIVLVLSVLLFTTAIEVQSTPFKSFFKEVAKDLFEGVVATAHRLGEEVVVDDNAKEIAENLVDIIEEDCESVCPPKEEGDSGAHVIQCIQCIVEEFGTPMLPEFLEAVLTIRSPELTEAEGTKSIKSGNLKDKLSESSIEELELDEMIEDGTKLLTQMTDLFEDAGVALFTALLGPCKDVCSSVTVPNTDPVPCIKCTSEHMVDESLQFINSALALFGAR